VALRRQLLDSNEVAYAEFLQELARLPREHLSDLYEFLGVRNVFIREKLQL